MTKSMGLRAVLDTNVVIAARKSNNQRSPNLELLLRWQQDEFTLFYCNDLRAAYEAKFAACHIKPEQRARFLRGLLDFGEHIELSAEQIRPVVVSNPDDAVLACALVGRATPLVTYDLHLLNLGERYDGVLILNDLHFLYAVRGDSPLA